MFTRTAHVYDLVYELAGKDYAAESAEVAALIRARVPEARTLLDVGCGTGAHLAHLRDTIDVVGVDLDEGMLAEARRRLGDVELVAADMRTFDLGRRFDAVVCLFSSIGYLPDRPALDQAVARMAAHLAPGGVLVIDGWVRPEAWQDATSVRMLSGRRDDVAVARLGRSERHGDKTVLELHHLVGTVDAVEHLVDRHELTLFSDDDYAEAFRRAGLAVEVVDSPYPDRSRFVCIAAS